MQILQDLARRLGGDFYGAYAMVPGPGHSRRDRSLSVTVGQSGRLIYNSFCGDSHAEIHAHLGLEDSGSSKPASTAERARLARQRALSMQQDRLRKLAFCQAVWAETNPIDASPAETYLREVRRIAGFTSSVLRYHPNAPLDYQRRRHAPALVALVQDRHATPCGLHLTALRPDGSDKAFGPNSRRVFGPIGNGSIRLEKGPGAVLAVAEGVETALSFAALEDVCTWSSVSTAGMAKFEPPTWVKRLIIAADGDDAGHRAATELASRVRRRCEVVMASAPSGMDWNDVLQQGGAV